MCLILLSELPRGAAHDAVLIARFVVEAAYDAHPLELISDKEGVSEYLLSSLVMLVGEQERRIEIFATYGAAFDKETNKAKTE